MAGIIKWKNKVIYEIYTRSFFDANNDGEGDLKGVIKKLPYIASLGFNALSISSVFDVNIVNNRSAVKSYKSLWYKFGNVADMKKLVTEATGRGIDVIIDLPIKYVSTKHEWFIKATEKPKKIINRNNATRGEVIEYKMNEEYDMFIFKNEITAAEAKLKTIDGTNMWEHVESVDRYYRRSIAKEQADLNWDSELTFEKFKTIISYWYESGVRGFKITLDDLVNEEGQKDTKTISKISKHIQTLYSIFSDIFIQLDIQNTDQTKIISYQGAKLPLANNILNSSLSKIGWDKEFGRSVHDSNWSLSEFVTSISKLQTSQKIDGGQFTNFLTNLNTSRSLSRFGTIENYREEAAKSLGIFLFNLRGIPSVYFGEEIGMSNTIFYGRNEFRDTDVTNSYAKFVDNNKVFTEIEMLKFLNINSRDNARIPMCWNKKVNGGFNKDEDTWIKTNQDYAYNNVLIQEKNETSILNFYKELIEFRTEGKFVKVLVEGDSEISISKLGIIKIIRTHGKTILTTFINLSKRVVNFNGVKGKIVLSSYIDSKVPSNVLRPFESIVINTKA